MVPTSFWTDIAPEYLRSYLLGGIVGRVIFLDKVLEAGAIYYWMLGISKIALVSGLISDSCLAKGYKGI